MIERGLINELSSFHAAYNDPLLAQSPDKSHGEYTRGIFQCIGFKEFHKYLMMSPDEQATRDGQKLLTTGMGTAFHF